MNLIWILQWLFVIILDIVILMILTKMVMVWTLRKVILCVSSFSNLKKIIVDWVIIVAYYNLEGVYTEVNQETIMSREFISANSEEVGGKLLVDVTKKFNRDKKIDLILK